MRCSPFLRYLGKTRRGDRITRFLTLKTATNYNHYKERNHRISDLLPPRRRKHLEVDTPFYAVAALPSHFELPIIDLKHRKMVLKIGFGWLKFSLNRMSVVAVFSNFLTLLNVTPLLLGLHNV